MRVPRTSRFGVLKFLLLALAALPLAACAAAPGIIADNEPARISKVRVSLAPNVSSPRFAGLVEARATQHAARFQRVGAATELRIAIKRHKYKNLAMALILTDANTVEADFAVVDVASGRVLGTAEGGAMDSPGGGVVGAVVGAAQDKEKVDERLADRLAKFALRQAYGSAIVDPVLYPGDAILNAPPVKRMPPKPNDKPDPAAKPNDKLDPAARPAPAQVDAGQDKTATLAVATSRVR